MASRKVVQDLDKKYIQGLLERYIEVAEYLIEKCRSLHHIKGSQKLERKCIAELKFLKSLSRKHLGFDESHLRSSNLCHYLGIIHAAENLPGVTQILQAFRCPGRTESLHVDVVAGYGHLWVKVIARKGQALHLIWAGQGQYGERDILLQADDYIKCTTVYPKNFMTPTMVFAFYNGVTSQMADALRENKVTVLGEIVEVSEDVQQKLASLNVDALCVDSEDSADENESADLFGTEAGFDGMREKLLNEAKYTDKTVSTYTDNESQSPMKTLTPGGISKPEEHGCNRHLNLKTDFNGFPENDCDNNNPDFCQRNDLESSVIHRMQMDHCDIKSEANNINSGQSNQPTRQVASNQKFYSINQESDVNIAFNSVGEASCAHAPLIDSDIASVSRHSNSEKLSSTNTGDCLKTNKTRSLYCPQNQSAHRIGFVNESVDKPYSEFDGYNWTSISLEKFIVSELLTSNTVDYSQLDEILTTNNIHTIDGIEKINLDVSSLITLVSAVSHGRSHFRFQEPILNEQAAEERRDPVLPTLHKFIEGKKLYACKTAVDSFQTILDTLGGVNECERAWKLMEKVTIVPDKPSFRAECLPETGKIKVRSKDPDSLVSVTRASSMTLRYFQNNPVESINNHKGQEMTSLIIFGTGDSMEAVTMTSNAGFVRAAEHQGVMFAVHIHGSRALTEGKEKTAEIIDV